MAKRKKAKDKYDLQKEIAKKDYEKKLLEIDLQAVEDKNKKKENPIWFQVK